MDDNYRSPELRAKEVAAAALLGVALALLMHWSFLPHLTTHMLQELRDPTLQAWQIAWDGYALVNQPLWFYDANIYYPLPRSLAFSDALIGYAPAGLIGSGPEAAILRYNVMFLFSYAFAFFGASLLARELGANRIASVLAGAAFAFAPFRLLHMRHLHVLSSGGIPLSLFLLVRGYRRKSPRLILAGWAVAAWQVSLGFTLGLPLFYLLAVLGALALVMWARGRGFDLARPSLVASAIGITVFLAWSASQAMPYMKVLEDHPESHRAVEHVAFFSPPPLGLVTAPSENYVWGRVTEGFRSKMSWAQEQALHPGLAVVSLALVGLAVPVFRKRLRIGLLAGVLLTWILCLGFGFAEGRFGYRWVYEYLPGWQGIRTPGRIFTLTSLGLALLAGGGATWLLEKVNRRGSWKTAIGGLLIGIVLLEGAGTQERYEVPLPPPFVAEAGGPQFHPPSDDQHDSEYMLWSTDGFPEIVNGVSGFNPTLQSELRSYALHFPDEASVNALRAIGVRTVLLHRDRAAGTDWELIYERSLAGWPGITTTEVGDVVVFEIGDP
ncbi:MAG: hypothetical protein ACR2KQ_03850 [Actinomycetota bacterium]